MSNKTTLQLRSGRVLGGTTVTTTASGALESSVRYLPFGGAKPGTGPLPTEVQFTGQRLDDTGLYYYGARYYDAEIARFISADPLVQTLATGQALNRYAYVLGNPLKYVDPTGLLSEVELLAGGVSQEQIGKWKNDAKLWEFILRVDAYERFNMTSGGGASTTFWFTYMFQSGRLKGLDLEDLGVTDGAGLCCDAQLVLKYLQATVGGVVGGTTPVGTVGTTPGVISLPANPILSAKPEVHLVVGYGPAFVPRGDVYAAKYYTAAGLDAVATGGRGLGLWVAGCDSTCLGQAMYASYLSTGGNPVAPLAVMGVYAIGGSADLWVPRMRRVADDLRR